MNVAKDKANLVDLTKALESATDHAKGIKILYTAKKRELDNIESDLISARLAEDRAKETLEMYKNTYVIETSLADERDAEIAEFVVRMPTIMAMLDKEESDAQNLPVETANAKSGRAARREKNVARRARQKKNRKTVAHQQ